MEHFPAGSGNSDPGDQAGTPPLTTEQLLLQQSILALKTTIGAAITAGRKSGETLSVQGGESRTFDVLDDGAEVVVTNYAGSGNDKYAEEITEKYGLDVHGATVEAYVSIEAEFEGPYFEYGIYMLSDGRALGWAKLFAKPIRTLNGQVGAEARRLADSIGLEEYWMKFEQRANYHDIKKPVSAAAEGYAEPVPFELTAAQVDAANEYVLQHSEGE